MARTEAPLSKDEAARAPTRRMTVIAQDPAVQRDHKIVMSTMSTMPGKHGKVASKTEVPRRSLVTALESGSRLKNTNKLTAKVPENLTTI